MRVKMNWIGLTNWTAGAIFGTAITSGAAERIPWSAAAVLAAVSWIGCIVICAAISIRENSRKSQGVMTDGAGTYWIDNPDTHTGDDSRPRA